MTEQDFKKLKAENDRAKSEAERAQGAFEEAMKNLSTEFGVADLKEAKAKISRDQKISEGAQTEFEQALSAYKKKWETE